MKIFSILMLTVALPATLLEATTYNPNDILYRPVAAPLAGTSYSDPVTLFDAPGYTSGVTTAGDYLATNPGVGQPWWGQGMRIPAKAISVSDLKAITIPG